MIGTTRLWNRRALAAATMVGVCTWGWVAMSAPPGTSQTPKKQKQLERALSPDHVGSARVGPGSPMRFDVPILPTVRALPTSAVIDAGTAITSAPMSFASSSDDARGSAATEPCVTESDCDDCNPCTKDECIFAAGAGKCVHLDWETVSPGQPPGDCNDGVFCNGQEFCSGGVCVPGTDPCSVGQFCAEDGGGLGAGDCVSPCTSDIDCPDNGLECDGTEFCDIAAGDTEGFCSNTGNPCGTGASCTEGVPLVCGDGRCCTPDVAAPTGFACGRATKADCEAGGGLWLGVGGDDGSCTVRPTGDNPDDFQCPRYSSGVAPQSIVGVIGPADAVGCEGFTELGDDYVLADMTPDVDFLKVNAVRYIGGSVKGTGHRPRITFYDANGDKIVDTITDFFASQIIAVRTVGFSEGPIIPVNGFITIKPAREFIAEQRNLIAATDTTNVGGSDVDVMWVNGGAITAADTGPLPPGERTLAFEIIGDVVPAPLGACCDGVTGECLRKLPWICERDGGIFQGVGTFCKACSNDFFTACNSAADCPPACSNDDTIDCTVNGDADCSGGGTCTPGAAQCLAVLPACTLSACCNTITGECVETTTGTCPNADFVLSGFGTSCDPDCCEQPTLSGGDTCATAPVHEIVVPPVGDPPVTYTFTGDNRLATCGDFPDVCQIGIFNCDTPSGPRDPGWWEAFHLTACANVRLDLCCSEPVVQPQWAFIVDACPCPSTTIGNSAVDPPVGNAPAENDRGAPFCIADNLWQTFGPLPAGIYYHPILSGPDGIRTQYQFHITVQACPLAACCVADTCAGVINELECRDLGGYWLGGKNVDETNGGPGDIVTCGAVPEQNPCRIGSCCTGPGQCRDFVTDGTPCDPGNPSTCMDRNLCETVLDPPGVYVGGALCDFPGAPCPVCEIESPGSCQLPVLTGSGDDTVGLSDLSAPGGPAVRADDFIPAGDTITKVCTWGAYLDATDPDGNGNSECVDVAPDNFLVTVYADAGGFPGAMIGQSTVSAPIRGVVKDSAYKGESTVLGDLYAYQLPLDTPISGMVPDTCHWLEIANNTAAPEGEDANRCAWHWLEVKAGGNEYSYSGTHDGTQGVYGPGGAKVPDLAWCVDTSVTPGGCGDAPEAACCTCPDEGGTCSVATFAACTGFKDHWDPTSPGTCTGVTCPSGAVGDDCLTEAIVASGNQFSFEFDTGCATTDGPPIVGSELGSMDMGSDIWVKYTAGCTGKLIASMCQTESVYDSNIAIFRDPANPTVCPCPGDSIDTISGLGNDEGCTVIADGGAGWLERTTLAGECWTVRVGGFGSDRGPGRVDIQCLGQDCFPATPPVLGQIPGPGGPLEDNLMNRFIPVTATNVGRTQAIRVTFLTMPPAFAAWEGQSLWAGEPKEFCNLGGTVLPPCAVTFHAAKLQCSGPIYKDWNALGIVHLFHEGITPGAVIRVQMIDESCSPSQEGNFSVPLDVVMARWGDTLRNCSQIPCTPPDGVVNITDVLGILKAFVSDPAAILKPRADLEPGCIDMVINISDALQGLIAFQGLPYPFVPSHPTDACLSTCASP